MTAQGQAGRRGDQLTETGRAYLRLLTMPGREGWERREHLRRLFLSSPWIGDAVPAPPVADGEEGEDGNG